MIKEQKYVSSLCRQQRLLVAVESEITRSGFKTPSNDKIQRCEFLRNAHILPCILRFLINSRLVFGRDLRF